MFLKARYLFHILLAGKVIHKPYHCHFQVTRMCNLKCLYCRVWREDSHGQKELTIDEIKILSENLKKVGVKSIVITGGEPLLRGDLIEIINIFSRQGFIVRLQTNGYLLNETFLEQAFSGGLDDIYISLDSLRPDVFLKINGIQSEVIFRRIVENIKIAAKLARKYNAGVFLTTVLQPANIEEVEDLVDFADKNNCLIGFYGLEAGSDKDINDIRAYGRGLIPDEEQRQKLKQAFIKLKELKKRRGTPIFSSYRLLDDYIQFYGSKNQDMKWDCNAGAYYLEILPDGKICICNATPSIEGFDYMNLCNLYNSPDKNQIFAEYRKKCSGCICTRQLEYLVEDFSDVANKTIMYLRTTLKG